MSIAHSLSNIKSCGNKAAMEKLDRTMDRREFELGDLPCAVPTEGAVEAGFFGFDEKGVIAPSVDDVRVITLEHARGLAGILFAISHLRNCTTVGIEPGNSKVPRSRSQREAVIQRRTAEIARLNRHYDDVVAAFAEVFGFEAAEALDLFVRLNCQGTMTQSSVSIQLKLF